MGFDFTVRDGEGCLEVSFEVLSLEKGQQHYCLLNGQ